MFSIIYFVIGALFAVKYFFNLFSDYSLIGPVLEPKIRNLYRIILFVGPVTMFLGWPIIYVAIFLVAVFNPEVTRKAMERKNLLDKVRGF